ncbi:MAG: hypothetical protein HC857_17230 [Synechococcales cyanobacterium RU_4_20]|nr:hypothetical protein [Synechococcales cyanobacterium RU_4_20]
MTMPVEVHFHGLEKSAAVEQRVRDKAGQARQALRQDDGHLPGCGGGAASQSGAARPCAARARPTACSLTRPMKPESLRNGSVIELAAGSVSRAVRSNMLPPSP